MLPLASRAAEETCSETDYHKTQLASCLIYAGALPAHPYNM